MDVTDEQTVTAFDVLDHVDLDSFLDEQAYERLGMSGEEFRRRLHEGEFDDICDDPFSHPDITFLTILESFAR